MDALTIKVVVPLGQFFKMEMINNIFYERFATYDWKDDDGYNNFGDWV